MGVQVDEAGGQRLPLGVKGFRCQIIDFTYGDDPSVADADVALAGGRAGAVDDLGVADQQVEHVSLPTLWPPATRRPAAGGGTARRRCGG